MQGARFGFGLAAGFFAFSVGIVLIVSALASNSWSLLFAVLVMASGISLAAWARKRLRRQ